MLSPEQAQNFAQEWIEAWNAHDLERILHHYHDDIEFTSPFIAKLSDDSNGTLRGKDALRSYFARGLAAYPELHFELKQVLLGVESVTLYYISVNNLSAAETMLFDDEGRVFRVLAHYSSTPITT